MCHIGPHLSLFSGRESRALLAFVVPTHGDLPPAYEGHPVSDSSNDPSPDTSRGLSRRTMVGATAWSVPVIVVATAAPAFARSGLLALSNTAIDRPGGVAPTANVVNVSTTVTNTDTTRTAAFQMTVRITPNNPLTYNFVNCTSTTPSGFNAPLKTSSGDLTNSGIFTYTATSQLAPNAPITFNPVITLPPSNGVTARSGSVTITAISGGAGNTVTSGAINYT